MSPVKPLAEEHLFDPPCLGIPAGAQAGARVCGPNGRFVEIALLVANGRVACAGFLTDPSGVCLGPASRWCELAQGRTPEACLKIDATSVARERGDPLAVDICLEAGRAAVAAWVDTKGQASGRGGRTGRKRADERDASERHGAGRQEDAHRKNL